MSDSIGSPERESILIVEDEAIISLEIERILKRADFRVTARVATGHEAVKTASALRPDLILMDIVLMGPMNGIDAAARIKKDRDVPIIFLTAYSDDRTLSQAKEIAPHAYLLKPFLPRQLLASIEMALYLQKVRQELKAANDNLAEANKMAAIGELAAGVTHELNNPMAVISALVESVQEWFQKGSPMAAQEPAEIQKLLKKINAQVFSCKRIIQKLVDFSRLQMDEKTEESLDVNDVARETISEVRQQRDVKVPVETDFAPVPPVEGYRQQLVTALSNILDNAIQAAENGGKVKISSWAEHGWAFIRFSDTGAGILPENLGKVLNPFFSTKPPGKGMGLGLAITYSVVRRMRGDIQIQSHKNKGTTVTVKLPCK